MQQCQADTVEARGPVPVAAGGPGATEPGAGVRAVRLTAVGMALIAVCYGLARFAYGLFVPSFRAEFGLDATAIGAVASGSYVGYCVAVVLATAATARWGARAVGVAAGGTAAVGTGLVALAPTTPVLVIGVVLAGSSTGLASPPMARAVARHVAPRLEPRAQTVVNAGTGLGVLVSGPVALLAAGEHWRWAWAAFSVVAVLVTAWAAVTVPRRSAPASTPTSAEPDRDPRPVPRRRPAWMSPGAGRLLSAAGLMGLGSAAVWTYARDLVTAAGVGDLTASVMWIVLGAAGLLGAFAGDLAVRLGPARTWTGAMLLLAAATAALALAPGAAAVALGAAAVFGAVYIASTGFLLLWGTRTFPDRPVLGVGAAFLFIAVGQAVGAPVLGLVADTLGTPGAFVAAAAIAVVGALVRPRREGQSTVRS
jgi:predicted MFS family arabinose efflux permease